MKEQQSLLARREILETSAPEFTIVPRHVLGGPGHVAPSDKLNVACVGVNGKGYSDVASMGSENIVALCDVDEALMAETLYYTKKDNLPHYDMIERAPKYRDFRKMLDTEKSIDAITVSTPDHTHAVIALTAMRMGKHAFVQKPLTQTVQEARQMAKVAKEMKLVTQMGNQGHASEEARLINEWIWDGAIGEVTEVHTWTNRPIWPQNIERPLELPALASTLDWDLWLGPAPMRPYHPAYAPFNWRGWWDFGTGALGDMGAHIIDHPYWALDLGLPDTVQASSTPFNNETYPQASKVHYHFPARGKKPAVEFTWYDGGLLPLRPEELEAGRRAGNESGGVIFVGTKGKLMCGALAESPRLIPETRMKEYKLPPKIMPRSPGCAEEWIAGIKNGTPTMSNFEYAAKLTEMMLLGNIAIRMAHKNTALKYDGAKMAFTNMPEANQFLTREYRAGWNLPA